MIKEHLCIVKSNTQIAQDIYLLTMQNNEIAQKAQSGQFVMLAVPGFFLRRPFCIANVDCHGGHFSLLYALVGQGTRTLSTIQTGDTLSAVAPLGRGFNPVQKKQVLVIAGGIGSAVAMQLCKELIERKNEVDLVLGFRSSLTSIPVEFFPQECNVQISTEDGSMGTKGFVTDILPANVADYAAIYMCGPLPMYKALTPFLSKSQNIMASFEARMGCGYGLCVGCSIKVGGCMKKVCTDGPVFNFYDVDLDYLCV